MEDMRTFFDKESYQFITIKKLAEYRGIEEETVKEYVID